jgi:YD repeat-containing protein
MKRSPHPRIAALRAAALSVAVLGAALLGASCASKVAAPAPAAEPAAEPAPAPAAPQKVAKERAVVVKVPLLVKWTSYYPDGLVDQYVTYKLSDDLVTVLEEDTYDASRPDPVQRLVYAYSGGRLSEETLFEAEGSVRSRKATSYDAAGRVADEKTLDSKGAAISSSAYSYDASGRMAEWRALDGAGVVRATVSYQWKDGRLASIKMMDAAGAASGSVDLEYGSDGMLARRYYRDAEGKLQKYEAYSYSGSALASSERRRADGTLSSMSVYEIGELGERVSETSYDGSGAVIGTTRYEYKVREEQGTEIYYE